jgi:hypothetical protein
MLRLFGIKWGFGSSPIFPSYVGHVIDLNHSFIYFLSLLKYFFILCNLITIGLKKGEKTLERKLERIQILKWVS